MGYKCPIFRCAFGHIASPGMGMSHFESDMCVSVVANGEYRTSVVV